MTLNDRILEFLDGTLPMDEEAELLHVLSVSPERRELLRSFMNQKAFFARDRRSIQVPYAAEQGLWQRLAPVMPAVPVAAPVVQEIAETAPVATRTLPFASFFGRTVSRSSAGVVSAVTLVLGIGLGYLAGFNQTPDGNKVYIQNQPAATQTPALAAQPQIITRTGPTRIVTRTVYIDRPVATSQSISSASSDLALVSANSVSVEDFSSHRALLNLPQHSPDVMIGNLPTAETLAEQAVANGNQANYRDADLLTPARVLPVEPVALHAIGGDGGIRPILHTTSTYQAPPKSILQRFEFMFSESFGREYPNSIATNNAVPLITNSSIGAYFQVLPRSSALWVGAMAGTANLTRKNLFTRVGNPIDPLQNVLIADTVHTQSSYLLGIAQYRLPLFSLADVTFSGGYGITGLGSLLMGELGLHYEVSREVGFAVGLRSVRFSYDLTQEREDAIRSGNGSLVVPKGVEEASPSYNLELTTGLFFHF